MDSVFKKKFEVFSKFSEFKNLLNAKLVRKLFVFELMMVGIIPHIKILNSFKSVEYAICSQSIKDLKKLVGGIATFRHT